MTGQDRFVPPDPASSHVLAVLALDDVIAFDLAAAVETFRYACTSAGRPAYRVVVCGPSPAVTAGPMGLTVPHRLDVLGEADTIVVPGRYHPDADHPAEVLDALRAAAARGARVASICVGAFTLAAAGLLDGRRATTHWAAAAELARRYPRVDVDPAVLYVDEGQVLTSAGAAAGLDLCLHVIRRDLGAGPAAAVARRTVMPLERAGGQAQFIVHEPPPAAGGSSLALLLEWLEQHLDQRLGTADLARRAGLSERSLHRRFREQTGLTPTQWLQTARVRRAQQLLEDSDLGVERIADRVGMGSPTTFRDTFKRISGTTPQAYRRAFPRSAA